MEHKNTPQSESQIPVVQQVISVLWPSFLTAGIATIFTFTFFDPQEIVACMGHNVTINRLGIYSLGFFLFWLLTSSTCALTCYFRRPVHA